MLRIRNFAPVSILLLLMACASVQQTNRISQPLGTEIVAGVGDTVLNITKEKNLPNVFGKADLFGRTTPTGMTYVQYLGVHNNKAIFKRKSVFIETGATTMNSTPLLIQNSATTTHSGLVGSTMYSGSSTTALPPTIIPANPPEIKLLDQGAIEISVDLNKDNKQLFVEGTTINIIRADSSKLIYIILE